MRRTVWIHAGDEPFRSGNCDTKHDIDAPADREHRMHAA